MRFVLLSVAEGEDKPLKHPTIFNSADVAVITKSDVAAAVEFDEAAARQKYSGGAAAYENLQSRRRPGKAWDAYVEFLTSRRAHFRAAAVEAK